MIMFWSTVAFTSSSGSYPIRGIYGGKKELRSFFKNLDLTVLGRAAHRFPFFKFFPLPKYILLANRPHCS